MVLPFYIAAGRMENKKPTIACGDSGLSFPLKQCLTRRLPPKQQRQQTQQVKVPFHYGRNLAGPCGFVNSLLCRKQNRLPACCRQPVRV